MIGPSRRPLTGNTQQSQETDIQVPGGIQTRNPSNRAAANPCHRLRGPPRSAHVSLPLRPLLLRLFDPFSAQGLSPLFFHHSHLGPAAARQFLVLTNMAVTFLTSSSDLFLGFPTGPLPPRLRSRICFGFQLSKIHTKCSAQVHVLTSIYVTMSVSLIGMLSSS